MTTPRPVILAAAFLLAGPAAAAARTADQARSQAAAQELNQRLAGCPTPLDCSEHLVRMALLEKPGPLQEAAHARAIVELHRGKGALFQIFREGKPDVQQRAFRLLTEGWSNLAEGYDGAFTALVQDGLDSPDRGVRRAAAEFAAGHRPLGLTHWIIDAAEDDRSLTLAALLTLDNLADPLSCRWVVGRLSDKNPVVRDQARRVLWRIGRPAADRLTERLDDPDAARRDGAMEAFLLIATPDDSPRLQAWLEAHGSGNPDLVKKITKALGEMEAGRYSPVPPPRAPLSFDVK